MMMIIMLLLATIANRHSYKEDKATATAPIRREKKGTTFLISGKIIVKTNTKQKPKYTTSHPNAVIMANKSDEGERMEREEQKIEKNMPEEYKHKLSTAKQFNAIHF